MSRADFLFELGTEELPPKELLKLAKALQVGVVKGLEEVNLGFAEAKYFATPRRLALQIKDLDLVQEDKEVERRGPAVAAAYKDGEPTKAALGFAASAGVGVDELETLETAKGSWLVARSVVKGKPAEELLPSLVEQAVKNLPIAKNMRWGSGTTEFVRPVHWVVTLLGKAVIPAKILDLTASNITFGHRFHAPQAIELNEPEDYLESLRAANVLADFAERREAIREQVLQVARENNATAVIDEALLDEVTGLVEWPVALTGSFDEEFLVVPDECLILSMKVNQKYFHLVDDSGALLPKFITIANIQSTNPTTVIEGNERVIRPRLADAKFFWDHDLTTPLESVFPRLEDVVFQQSLGTLADKSHRLAVLSESLGAKLGVEKSLTDRAAKLAKCDLLTLMVGEFPELQGSMGRAYAEKQGEDKEVAAAIEEQYLPRFAGDSLPASKTGWVISLADRLDTITGIYGIGLVPTGDRDPFALRRAALGLSRIIIEKKLDLNLVDLIKESLKLHKSVAANDELVNKIYSFIIGRLRAYFAEQDVSAEAFEAVRVIKPAKPLDFAYRVDAIKHFAQLEGAESLAAAHKRIHNILRKLDGEWPSEVNPELFEQEVEEALFASLEKLSAEAAQLFDKGDYKQALVVLAQIRQPVDDFFDQVMVMAQDESIRNNRLALLNLVYQQFIQIADISHL